MIGKLSGIIDSFGKDHLILDVQGVGYLVHAGSNTLSNVGQSGDAASLLIDTHVREDAITLYGFSSSGEQDWFRLLTSVQGVGAKAGLAILSVLPPDQLGFAIAAQDKAALTQADGVGPKLATRILTELKDKVANMELSVAPKATASSTTSSAPKVAGIDQDAVSALVNLGYGRAEAYSTVAAVLQKSDEEIALEELIRVSLKELSA